jgi:hypothetical protein
MYGIRRTHVDASRRLDLDGPHPKARNAMNLQDRITKLEDDPESGGVTLHLRDGGTYHYAGTKLEFFSETLRQHGQGGGELVDVVWQAVSTEGCKLAEFLQLLMGQADEAAQSVEPAAGETGPIQ